MLLQCELNYGKKTAAKIKVKLFSWLSVKRIHVIRYADSPIRRARLRHIILVQCEPWVPVSHTIQVLKISISLSNKICAHHKNDVVDFIFISSFRNYVIKEPIRAAILIG